MRENRYSNPHIKLPGVNVPANFKGPREPACQDRLALVSRLIPDRRHDSAAKWFCKRIHSVQQHIYE